MVGGVSCDIRTDYRAIIKLCKYLGEPDYANMIGELLIRGLYIHPEQIPAGSAEDAINQAVWFINCGELQGDDHRPTLMDWEQDASLIIPAVNRVAGVEVRAIPYIHWWTFMGYYMEIGEGTFSTVIGIRSKLAKGKKLEKWEKEYLQEHRKIVLLKTKMTSEEKAKAEADKAALRELLGD